MALLVLGEKREEEEERVKVRLGEVRFGYFRRILTFKSFICGEGSF